MAATRRKRETRKNTRPLCHKQVRTFRIRILEGKDLNRGLELKILDLFAPLTVIARKRKKA